MQSKDFRGREFANWKFSSDGRQLDQRGVVNLVKATIPTREELLVRSPK